MMLSDNEDIFYECDKCGADIGFANIIWEISRSEGRFVKNYGYVETEVLKEEPLLVFCAVCGSNSIDFNEIRNKFSNSADEVNEIWDDESSDESVTPLEICDKCGTGIDIGEAVTKINCSTGKIYCNSPGHDIPDYFANDSATVCTLCQDCGEKIDNKGLRTILSDTVVKSPFNKPDLYDDPVYEIAIEMNRRR